MNKNQRIPIQRANTEEEIESQGTIKNIDKVILPNDIEDFLNYH